MSRVQHTWVAGGVDAGVSGHIGYCYDVWAALGSNIWVTCSCSGSFGAADGLPCYRLVFASDHGRMQCQGGALLAPVKPASKPAAFFYYDWCCKRVQCVCSLVLAAVASACVQWGSRSCLALLPVQVQSHGISLLVSANRDKDIVVSLQQDYTGKDLVCALVFGCCTLCMPGDDVYGMYNGVLLVTQ